MYDINLIPNSIKYKRNITLRVIGKIFIGIVVLAVISSGIMIKPYQKYELLQKIKKVESSINVTMLDKLDSAEKKLEALKQESASAYSTIPFQRIKLTDVVKKVQNILPSSIEIIGINYTFASKEIKFDFKSKGRDEIPILLKRLYNNPLYTDINISAITEDKSCSFSILLKVKL